MGETLKLAELPLNLPAGWDFAKVFGERSAPFKPLEQRTETGVSGENTDLWDRAARKPAV